MYEMKKVDETIEAICERIQEEMKNKEAVIRGNIPELTSALAELIVARAQSDTFEY